MAKLDRDKLYSEVKEILIRYYGCSESIAIKRNYLARHNEIFSEENEPYPFEGFVALQIDRIISECRKP
jgi:hypothetical protein